MSLIFYNIEDILQHIDINLQEINLSYKYLIKIPDLIGNLINLQKLYLDNNKLIKIPDTIGNLINLETLYLTNNKLIKIPKSIRNLINLQYLYLNNNNLIKISNIIEKIKGICIDYNSYNKNIIFNIKRIYVNNIYRIRHKVIKKPYNCKLIYL